MPFMPAENCVGDSFEERVLRRNRHQAAPPDLRQHRCCTRARFTRVHCVDVAHFLPDVLAVVLAVNEERLRPDGSTQSPKPFSFESRTSRAYLRGLSVLIRASVNVTVAVGLLSHAVAARNRSRHVSVRLREFDRRKRRDINDVKFHWHRRCVGGCSSMAEQELPKLKTRVRFPSPAPVNLPGTPSRV